MRTRHRRPTRTRYFVLAFAVAGVLGAGGIASAQTIGHHAHPSARTAARLGPATNVADASRWRRPHPTRPTATATPTAVPTSPSPTPTTAAPTTAAPTSATPTTEPTTAAPPTTGPVTTPPTTAPSGDPVIQQVLDHINAARAANGLPAYALSAALSKASAAHNALMVGGCGLSHQCPGEASLGDRFTAAGVPWTSAGENIGQGNASDNQASIIAAANGLTDLMLAEVAPDDGHKKNLLNTGFKHIGLAVTRGSDGRVWMTQDFVN